MNSHNLAIIMPVYNAQASVRRVVTEWFREIEHYSRHLAAGYGCNLIPNKQS